MKRNYFSPAMSVVEVECNEIIATSPDGNIGIDQSGIGGSEQLSNRQQGKWGDVWNK